VGCLKKAVRLRLCASVRIMACPLLWPGCRLLQFLTSRSVVLIVTQADYTWPEQVDLNDDVSIDRWLVRLEEANQAFRRGGITLGYHNHQIEFIRSRGKPVMQRIFDETTIAFEIDTFWIQVGGESPTAWVSRCAEAGRLPFIHLKDYRIGYDPKEGFVRQFSELGRGGLDFKGIIAAAEKGGCCTYTIEQDNCYGRDEFEAVAESFRYLCDHFVR